MFAQTHTQTQLISEEIKFCSIDLANIPPSKILCSCNICSESVLFMRVILARENSGILMWPDQVHQQYNNTQRAIAYYIFKSSAHYSNKNVSLEYAGVYQFHIPFVLLLDIQIPFDFRKVSEYCIRGLIQREQRWNRIFQNSDDRN